MRISIVTPSFKQPEWLRLCLSSVADQKGDFELEHIIQDNCSGDDVAAIAAKFPGAQLIAERDQGMYDAVNRGLRRSTGDICAYLNCDEQYLPGSLEKIVKFFESNPGVDVVFADCVVVKEDGSYICSRPAIYPWYYHTKICHLNVFTAATFMRRRVFEQHNHYFNPKLKDVADCVWVLGLIEEKIPFQTLNTRIGVFTETGANMGAQGNANREFRELKASAPLWARSMPLFWVLLHRLRKLLDGAYHQKPFSYSIFTRANPSMRTRFDVDKPSSMWWGRLSMGR